MALFAAITTSYVLRRIMSSSSFFYLLKVLMLSNEQTDFHQIFDIYPVLFVNGGTP